MTTKTGIVRGKWSLSPLREAKFLLAILKQEGLAGKGLIAAFERWAPRMLGYPRSDMAALYQRQTGQPLTDTLLIQQAYKVVSRGQIPPEAEVFRQQLLRNRTL